MNIKIYQKHLILSLSLLIIFSIILPSTEAQLISDKFDPESLKVLEAIALYPETTKDIILRAAQNHELLVKISNLQKNSKKQFQELLVDFSREIQKKVWDMTRYPDLIPAIIADGPKSRSQLFQVSEKYPEKLRDTILLYGTQLFDLLQQIDTFKKETNNNFNRLIKTYPTQIQKTFQELIKLPEVMSLLTENMSMTILLGDMAKNGYSRLKKELEMLQLQLAKDQTKANESWKQTLENDTEALQEFKEVAQEFAQEEGYGTDDILSPEEEPVEVTARVYFHPYPYWFSYPYWHSWPRWYVYPYWYYSGFYLGPRNTIVIVDLPAYKFVHWYFYNPRLIYRYPRLAHCYYGYYERYPHLRSGFTYAVDGWHKRNRSHFPDGWFRNDRERVQRFRDYGRFEFDFSRHQRVQGNRSMSRQQFYMQNSSRYPYAFSKPKSEQQTAIDRQRTGPPAPGVKLEKPGNSKKKQNARDHHRQTIRKRN